MQRSELTASFAHVCKKAGKNKQVSRFGQMAVVCFSTNKKHLNYTQMDWTHLLQPA